MKLRILIADDSVVYRTQIKAALAHLQEVEIVGTGSNGRLALERLSVTPADLIILDLEMPEMDGIATLKEMARLGVKSKVIVFSSLSKRGAEITMEALRLGATDFITKPDGAMADLGDPKEKIRSLLEPRIRAICPEYFSSDRKPATLPSTSNKGSYPVVNWDIFSPKLVVIGSSTGGPTVLETIFSSLKGPYNCPIVVTQHMPPLFTATLAERLAKSSGIKAKEAQDGEVLQKNTIYLAPGNFHLRLEGDRSRTIARLDQGEHINFVRPAVDPLFETASAIFRENCLAVVLTGMGSDGRSGAEAVKRNGGIVIIQEEKSCVVFGMPGAVHAVGAFDKIATPAEVVDLLQEKVAPFATRAKAI